VAQVAIRAGGLTFGARFEDVLAPRTCATFRALLPFRRQLLQARWSGEAAWVPLGDLRLDLPSENATAEPGPGQLLFYPRGVSETEILFPYGITRFASKFGALKGNHFLTITEGATLLAELGQLVLWKGAQPIVIEAAP